MCEQRCHVRLIFQALQQPQVPYLSIKTLTDFYNHRCRTLSEDSTFAFKLYKKNDFPPIATRHMFKRANRLLTGIPITHVRASILIKGNIWKHAIRLSSQLSQEKLFSFLIPNEGWFSIGSMDIVKVTTSLKKFG